jgi:hypothetical protein
VSATPEKQMAWSMFGGKPLAAKLTAIGSFLSFFAWESLGNVRVHAMQHLLIGLALRKIHWGRETSWQ